MTHRRSAFTLLEVMISLAIFILAAVLLGGSYLNVLTGYEAANRAVDRNEDVRFARQAVLTETDPEVVQKGGSFDSANNRHVDWKATLDPTETPDVFQVTFECVINAPDMKKPERVTEVFRLLRPTWSKPDEREKLRSKTRDRIMKILGKSK